ncbi:MAG TPA: hypothetical protein VMH48_11100 [Methylomirabilota bacterium]|nr:hypothetical protein [Methylomirabilota bacterium]
MAAKKKPKTRDKRSKAHHSKMALRRNASSVHSRANRKSLLRKALKKKNKVLGPPALVEMVAFEPRGLGSRTAGQAGDLQGLSGTQRAAAESVEELLEEGNAFEADFVKGVEDADDSDEIEVESHEVLEDDVPDEYLEQP